MTLSRIKEILEADAIAAPADLERDVKMAGGSDLMSDVLSFMKPGSLLLTGLTNPQCVRTAEMAEIVALCFVRSKKPPQETVDLAQEKGVPLLLTHLTMYEACGRLYQSGLPGRRGYKGDG
jgi:predicted transcriptional regulator